VDVGEIQAFNMTPLETIITRMIAEDGPMPLDRFMTLCLSHPEHGYYMSRDPFGVAGDFTTAPEISQVFGELIGVWVAQVWQLLESPRKFALVELGPGRGTLMMDVLRVLQKIPACAKAVEVHLVETSPVLRGAQLQRVPTATWHGSVASLPGLPTILLASEFFDALPIRQFERVGGRVFERVVGEGLVMGLVPAALRWPFAGEGMFEDSSIRDAVALQLGDHLTKCRGAGLIIDYGHLRSAMGDTLQAMKAHKYCGIVEHIGEADLTSHVNFEGLGRGFIKGGAKVAGALTQGQFLEAMGLDARTQVLAAQQKGEKQKQIIAASNRLANPDEMGELFKVMAVTGGLQTSPYPFGKS
jgi:NADH dehydrogenase [ubiquinone] 1 alpha subcomplex assembly factor 7